LIRQKISQGEFTRRLGVTPAAINNYVSGKRRPRLTIALRIAELTGLPILVLLYDAKEIRDHQ
jgi:transcriptional regulator with XRE-family HTH domain